MKRIINILAFMFLSISAKADYNGSHIKFEFESAAGEINIGFAYFTWETIHPDSLSNTIYLKKALGQSWNGWNESDSLVFFMERIKYEFRNVGDRLGDKIPIYALNNKQIIPSHDIKSITIIDIFDYSYGTGISSPLSISDTTWINKDPLISYSFGGYFLCYYQIFVHAKSEKIDDIIKRLQAKEELEKDLVFDDFGVKKDREFLEIIKELYGEKVVVITECSC